MTTQETALCELLARGRDLSILREIISFATERLMELEVGGLTGASNRERSPDRREGEGGSLPASRFLDQPALEDSSLALGWQREEEEEEVEFHGCGDCVCAPPCVDGSARRGQAAEHVLLQAFVAKSVGEAFHESVLLGLARGDVVLGDAKFLQPVQRRVRGQLGAVVPHHQRRAAGFSRAQLARPRAEKGADRVQVLSEQPGSGNTPADWTLKAGGRIRCQPRRRKASASRQSCRGTKCALPRGPQIGQHHRTM